jgi:SAM-dependent methyltransferase
MIYISEEVIAGVEDMAVGQAVAIGACSADTYVRYYLDVIAHAQALYPVACALGINSETRVIEIGSGIGLRCLLGRDLLGAEFVGVEPCCNSFSALGRVIAALREANPQLPFAAVARCGEETGLPGESFDVALSFEVIEHVQDPKKVLGEIWRLLKPGGRAYLSTCNYASFYEGHFRCFWWPFAGKRWQARYLRLIGRNPAFLAELNLITKQSILRTAAAIGFTARLADRFCCAASKLPPLVVNYPRGYALPEGTARPFAHRLIEHPRVAAGLTCLDREYKLSLELSKP